MILNYNDNGVLITTLSPGLFEYSYQILIFIQIIDDSGAITVFEIPDYVTVVEDNEFIKNATLEITENLKSGEFIEQFKILPISEAAQKIISTSSIIQNMNITKNDNELISKNFSLVLNNLKVNDLSDIKIVTMVYGLITKNNIYVSKSIKLLENLKSFSILLYNFSETNDLTYLKQASDKILESIGNIFYHCPNNQRVEFFDMILKILNDILKIITKHLSISQQTEVNSPNIHYKTFRLVSTELNNKEIILSGGDLKISNNSINQMTTILQSFSIPHILYGINGKELNLDNSTLLSLSYFSESGEKLKVDNGDFKIKIKRSAQNEPEFIQYNQTNDTDPTIKAIIYKTNLKDSNSSIIFQLKPENKTQSFLVLIKFNQNPSLLKRSYDLIFPLCPEMLINDTFYQIFVNSTTVKSYFINNHVGFSISSIDDGDLLENYCLKNLKNFPDILKINLFNSNNFSVRIFSMGCYYLEQSSSKWSSSGMDVIDPSFDFTNCFSSHLTVFASGFIVLPSEIDFESVFSNSSFEKNMTVYIMVIGLAAFYIFAAIIFIYVERKSSNEIMVNYLGDNFSNNGYFYEVLIFTGSRKNAGTDSKLFLNLYGLNGETQFKKLECTNPAYKPFKRGGVDCFVLRVDNNLGPLQLCRIYQDNSGKNNASSLWYLKYIIISDLQTNEKYYFICEKWFDITTGQIDQKIPVSEEEKLKNLSYLFKRQAKDKISDEHLWLSLITKPTMSNFSRVDRLTCCYVLLLATMLANILYYDVDKSTKTAGIEIGPFRLTAQQVKA